MRILEINFWPVIDSVGGAERVFCNMANELTKFGHNVAAVCFEDKIGLPFYPLMKEVNFYNLQEEGEQIKVPRWRKILREIARPFGKIGFKDPYASYRYKRLGERLKTVLNKENPDIIVCYDINSLQFLYKLHLNDIKCVFMLHMDAETFWHGVTNGQHWKINTVEQIEALKDVECIQVLLPRDKEFLEEKLHREIVLIPNVVSQVTTSDNELLRRDKIVINIGRLDKRQKQQHLLIDAFAKIATSFPEWQLHFYGADFTKNYRKKLEAQIENYKLDDKIKLMGITNDSNYVLKKASIFAFPSAFEGFPLAMTEAMAVGLPCIAFESCLAVRQLIVNGENGILTKQDTSALSKGLECLMRNEELRMNLGLNAKKSMEAYAPKKIWQQWDKLLSELVNKKHNNL